MGEPRNTATRVDDEGSLLPLPHLPEGTQGSPTGEPLDRLAASNSRTTILAKPLSQGSNTDLSEMAEAIERAIGEDAVTDTVPHPIPVTQTTDLEADLFLSDSSTSLDMDTLHPSSVTPAQDSPSDSTLSSGTPTIRVTPRMLGPGTSETHRPQTLHEGIMRVGEDLQQLVDLNTKVTPPEQLDLLWRIHNDLQHFMAPYRIYHG